MSTTPDHAEGGPTTSKRLYVRARVIRNEGGHRFGWRCERDGECLAEFLAPLCAELLRRLNLERPLDPEKEPEVLGEIHLQFEGYTDVSFTLREEEKGGS